MTESKFRLLKSYLLNLVRRPFYRNFLFHILNPNFFFNKKDVSSLEFTGIEFVSNLFPVDTLNLIENFAFRSRLIDPWSKKEYYGITKVPADVNVVHVADIWTLSNISVYIDSLVSIKEIVSRYFSGNYILDGIDCWWTLPSKIRKEAEFYHRDGESLRILKLFVYITDVDVNSAPNHYIRFSHRIDKLSELRRYSDDEVFKHYPKVDEHVALGASGTTFLADTYGIHRGDTCTKPRLVFQIRFTSGKSFYYKDNILCNHFRKLFH